MVKESVGEIPIKKRRKSNIAPPSATPKLFEGDIYKGVIDYEENEALLRDPDKDKELFISTCDEIRSILEEISVLKTKEDSKVQIAEKRIQACMKFVILKKLNRLEKFRTKNSRDTLNKVKQQVDSYHLQLQNLLYEILHLKKEVTKCLQFKSKDEEIDLVSVEEFYKEAPENVSRPKITRQDPHQLKLARLEWELEQRKQLAELCKHLQAAKETVSNDITKKRERLNNLTPRLRTILESTKPLQDYLGLPLDRIRKQHQVAQLLPKPLFVLYVQTDAYREACDSHLTVTVIGDQEEARIHSMPDKTPTNNDTDSEQELEENEKRHHRKLSKVDRLEAKRNSLLTKHPLSVELVFKQEDENRIILKFYYLTNLHVVTVEPQVHLAQPLHGTFAWDLLTKENVLKCLFPYDLGQESPNIANHYQLQHVGLDTFDVSQLGLPYIWAQRIAGLDFMSTNASTPAQGSSTSSTLPETSHSVSQASVERVMRAIRNRFKARIALYKQIQQLEQAIVRIPPQLNNARFPIKIHSVLESWQPVSWKEYSQTRQSNILLQEELISEEDIFYRAVITRGTAKMIAFVAVKCDYPMTPALFSLRLFWHGEHYATNNDSIRDIEREINVYWQELVTSKGWAYSLIAAQLMRLEMCMDVYLETSDSGSPPEFPRDKVFFKGFRGRDRSRPYKFLNRANGIFTQR